MHRYISVVWNPQDRDSGRAAVTLRVAATSRSNDWTIAYEGPGLLVVQINTCRHHGAGNVYALGMQGGVVLGQIFARAENHVVRGQAIDNTDAVRIVASGGQRLIDEYWGSYVAFIHDRSAGRIHVLRDPTADKPCYHTSHGGADIFFSHVEDCVRFLGMSFEVNRKFLTRWLVFSFLTNRETGLMNVEYLLAGERLTIVEGKTTRSLLWNPVEIAQTPRFDSPEDAAARLRTTVQGAVNAWASCYERITHQLSGGLDSSIVAACLAQAPSRPDVTCLNWVLDVGFIKEPLHLPGLDQHLTTKLRAIAGHGDERYFARLVAERWKLPLVERKRDNHFDLARQRELSLRVRPIFYTTMEQDELEVELATVHGTQAFFTGQMGDSVFAATFQPFAAIDYAYLHGVDRGLWERIAATSRLSKQSLPSTLKTTIRHGLLARPYQEPFNVLQPPTLLADELRASLTIEDFNYPLDHLCSNARLPPGKKAHMRGVGASRHYDAVFRSGQYADHIHPLNSQPVWEYMLRVPMYTVLFGGTSRGLARRAFGDLLPPEVKNRQTKGTGSPFYQQMARRNLPFLRAQLLDGLLVRDGYLDRNKLEACLSAEEPFLMVNASSLLFYFTAETWVQQWTACDHNSASALHAC